LFEFLILRFARSARARAASVSSIAFLKVSSIFFR
jgi:hypothetical protein